MSVHVDRAMGRRFSLSSPSFLSFLLSKTYLSAETLQCWGYWLSPTSVLKFSPGCQSWSTEKLASQGDSDVTSPHSAGEPLSPRHLLPVVTRYTKQEAGSPSGWSVDANTDKSVNGCINGHRQSRSPFGDALVSDDSRCSSSRLSLMQPRLLMMFLACTRVSSRFLELSDPQSPESSFETRLSHYPGGHIATDTRYVRQQLLQYSSSLPPHCSFEVGISG